MKNIFVLAAAICLTANLAYSVSTSKPGQVATAASKAVDYNVKTAADELKIMTYNLLNLFDAEHTVEQINGQDVDKHDYTFTPTGSPGKKEFCDAMRPGYYKDMCYIDWTTKRTKEKIARIKYAISLQGDLPDILAVQEIENANVAQMLAKALGYGSKGQHFEITESADKRGIDVALFYNYQKLRIKDVAEISVNNAVFGAKPTRNILRVLLQSKVSKSNELFLVYVNHWPSQGAQAPMNPKDAMTKDKRIVVAKILQEDIDKQLVALSYDAHVIVMGDFNTITSDIPNGFANVLQDPNWNHALLDARKIAKTKRNSSYYKMPPGTYWYYKDRMWSEFDKILLSENLVDGSSWEADPTSFRIVAHPELTESAQVASVSDVSYPGGLFDKDGKAVEFAKLEWETTIDPLAKYKSLMNSQGLSVSTPAPLGYDFLDLDKKVVGYSDHLPVMIKLKLK